MNPKVLALIILTMAAVLSVNENLSAQTIRANDVTEIIFEDGDGFCSDCGRIFTLRSDGAATARGGRNSSSLKGDYRAEIGNARFASLAKKIVGAGFFDFQDRYEGTTSDAATVKITLVYPGERKKSENFGESDDAKIKSVEDSIRTALREIKWLAVGSSDGENSEPFGEINRIVERIGGWTGNDAALVEAFGKLRNRLGAGFEPELWKYLGGDVDRHYWAAFYVENGRDRNDLKLALRIRENALALIGEKSDDESLMSRIPLHVTAAIGAAKIKARSRARRHKRAAEDLIKNIRASAAFPRFSTMSRQFTKQSNNDERRNPD